MSEWLTRRRFFIAMAFILLFATTARFDGDPYAFAWSLVVLGGAMVLE